MMIVESVPSLRCYIAKAVALDSSARFDVVRGLRRLLNSFVLRTVRK